MVIVGIWSTRSQNMEFLITMKRSAQAAAAHRRIREDRVDWFEQLGTAQHEIGLWVSAAGYHHGSLKPGRIEDRRLGQYGALWITRGHGSFENQSSGKMPSRPGSLVWLFPDIPHSYASKEGWTEQWVLFGGSMAETFQAQGILNPTHPLTQVGVVGPVERLFAQIKRRFQEGGPLTVSMVSACLCISSS